MRGAINVTCDSSVTQAGIFWGRASPPGAGQGCWGLIQGTFSVPGARGIPPWPFPLLVLSSALQRKDLDRFPFPRGWFGVTSPCPGICNLALPCPAGNSIFLRREGAGCGKSLPWGG